MQGATQRMPVRRLASRARLQPEPPNLTTYGIAPAHQQPSLQIEPQQQRASAVIAPARLPPPTLPIPPQYSLRRSQPLGKRECAAADQCTANNNQAPTRPGQAASMGRCTHCQRRASQPQHQCQSASKRRAAHRAVNRRSMWHGDGSQTWRPNRPEARGQTSGDDGRPQSGNSPEWQPQTSRLNTKAPLVPPKPKLFFSATSIFKSLAVLAQ